MEQGMNTGEPPSVDDIRAGLSGRGPRPESGVRKPSRPQKSRPERSPASSAPRQPTAPDMASFVAQRWYDLGNQQGWEFPYNVNFLALAISARIEKDEFLVRVREKQGEHQVQRIVEKMIDIWWRGSHDGGYQNGEVNRRNAKEMFLDEDWDDLRYFAWSSLRAKYLDENSTNRRTVKALLPEGEGDFGRDLRQRLDNLRLNQQIEDMLEQPEVDRTPVDETARERLRSFAERYRRKSK